jgi:Flp pilus assembly protein TadD
MKAILITLTLLVPVFSSSPDLVRATKLYRTTDYDGALHLLEQIPESKRDAETILLTGKSLFMKGEFKKSTESFERAVQLEATNSEYYHWLGRAYGRRAETSSFLTAPGLASKARQNFEKAVQLDPRNGEAINDLFEYYKEAPGILGGGLDKAQKLLNEIKDLDPAEYHFALAQLAEKRNDYGVAEQQLRRAIELAPRMIGRLIDLARFLAKRGRFSESEQIFRQAEAIAPDEPKLLFARASTYIRANRNLEEARDLLKRYIDSPLTPDNPPREAARKLLSKAARSD